MFNEFSPSMGVARMGCNDICGLLYLHAAKILNFFWISSLNFLVGKFPRMSTLFPHLTGSEKSPVIPRPPKNNVDDSNPSLLCQCSSLMSIFQTVPIAFIV